MATIFSRTAVDPGKRATSSCSSRKLFASLRTCSKTLPSQMRLVKRNARADWPEKERRRRPRRCSSDCAPRNGRGDRRRYRDARLPGGDRDTGQCLPRTARPNDTAAPDRAAALSGRWCRRSPRNAGPPAAEGGFGSDFSQILRCNSDSVVPRQSVRPLPGEQLV